MVPDLEVSVAYHLYLQSPALQQLWAIGIAHSHHRHPGLGASCVTVTSLEVLQTIQSYWVATHNQFYPHFCMSREQDKGNWLTGSRSHQAIQVTIVHIPLVLQKELLSLRSVSSATPGLVNFLLSYLTDDHLARCKRQLIYSLTHLQQTFSYPSHGFILCMQQQTCTTSTYYHLTLDQVFLTSQGSFCSVWDSNYEKAKDGSFQCFQPYGWLALSTQLA